MACRLVWPPAAGWIVSCAFPYEKVAPITPGPVARPCLIVEVHDDKHVVVIYGTAQNTSGTVSGGGCNDFEIEIDVSQAEQACSNLSEQTRYDFRQAVLLPYTSAWFRCTNGRPTPLVGMLPQSLRQRAAVAKQHAEEYLRKRPKLKLGYEEKMPEVTRRRTLKRPIHEADAKSSNGDGEPQA